MVYAYFALSAVLAVALAGRLAWPRAAQRLGRIPPDDQAAITLFLANRDETAVVVKKEIWASGPEGRFASANIYGVPHRGRFYHVLAQDAGGARYRHELAATGSREQFDFVLLQQGAEGFWTPVRQ
jgi:hypothetical protein